MKVMSSLYVACDFGADTARIMLGSLHMGRLTLSEIRRFTNKPIREKDSIQWNIPELYQETLNGLRTVGAYQENISGISCDSWAADYMLFEKDGSLITPTYHHYDPRSADGMKKVMSKVPWETIYDETGVERRLISTLFQLGAEKS